MKWHTLPDGEDWLLEPVSRGMCSLESLKDGTLDLADIVMLNDKIAVEADNERLAQRIAEDARGRD